MLQSAAGQEAPTYHYAIEDLSTGEVVRRGEATEAGIPGNVFLGANRSFREWLLELPSGLIGSLEFRTPPNGGRLTIPPLALRSPVTGDTDGDGLSDDAEFILGTDGGVADTDGDGIDDGAEIEAGTNPLDDLAAATGVIGVVETPGEAVDVCAFNDVAITANRGEGVTVFNVFNAMSPVVIAQVDTPGDARRVACGGDLIAVADGPAGVAVIDLSVPAEAGVTQQVPLVGSVGAVAMADRIGFAGTASGLVYVIDLASGQVLASTRDPSGRPVRDLVVAGNLLYVLTDQTLTIRELLAGALQQVGRVDVAGRTRLVVGGGLAYLSSPAGYTTVDVSDPSAPAVLESPGQAPMGVTGLAVTGSGQLLTTNQFVEGRPPRLAGVAVYDGSDPAEVEMLLTEFPTPGTPAGVSIFNGLAYVAASSEGLQVVNYLAFDTGGVPPTVVLTGDGRFSEGAAEERSLLSLSAEVTDDVQVRNVEFYLDGIRIATDGNFPFEHRFRVPSADTGAIRLQARASDTGGNATFTDEIVLQLTPDRTPPVLVGSQPENGGVVGMISRATASFSEAVTPASLTSGGLVLLSSGPDGLLETSDDAAIPYSLDYRDDQNLAVLDFSSPLEPGRYQLRAAAPTADLAGNAMTEVAAAVFTVYPFTDRDGDSLADDLELIVGTDPDIADSDGDGTPDGLEDADGDGLSNIGEVILGTGILVADTDDDGILDGDEDRDFDGLADGVEVSIGLDPNTHDTDGDGFDDRTEISEGTNPLRRDSRLPSVATAQVSWLNARLGPGPTELARTAASSPAPSFYRTELAPAPAERFGASPFVTYDNQEPAP